jgi:MFS family permease
VATTVTERPGYGRLLRTPGALPFVLTGFAARQPFAMLIVSIVLLVRHTTGSYGTAGAVAAAAGISMALFAPQSGRLADRFGQRAVLVPGVLAHTASAGALVALTLSDAPLWTLFTAAVPVGATVPQIGPMVRARWAAKLTGTPLMTTATAFESVTDEFTFVIGPVLATTLCTGVHPAAGLVAEAGLTAVGGLLFAARRGSEPALPAGRSTGHATGTGRASALAVPGVRVLAVAFLGVGAVFGGMQVSLTAFAEAAGHPGAGGLLYGVFASGNMLAGLVCGAIAWKRGPQQRLIAGYTALALVTATLWAVHPVPLLGLLGLLTGLCIAPALISGFTLVDTLVGPSARTEAFTWLTGAVALGQAAAVMLAGHLTDAYGVTAGFLVPPAGTGLALLVLMLLRTRLTPPATSSPVVSGSPVTESGTRVIGHRTPVTVD